MNSNYNNTRAFDAIAQELDELLAKSPPYSLSSPSFGSPTLHDFVKGLILSTHIIEVIDKHLPNGYRADWGQVIDKKDANTLSNECDIIIYKGQPFKEIKNKSMKFVLVDKSKVKVVIQVRSSIQSITSDDRNYCKKLKQFVPEIWYISECCWATTKHRTNTIRRELKKVGYKQFFYFCRVSPDPFTKDIDYKPFVRFIELLEKLK